MLLNEIAGEQPEAKMLVGVPGSGKSTYIAKLKEEKPWVVLSTDDLLDEVATKNGLSYSEAFAKHYKSVETQFFQNLKTAINAGKDIIIDQTNISPASRAKKLRLFPSTYRKTAVVFHVDDDDEELQRRLDKRAKETGKVIPAHVVANMKKSFVEPSKSEGFSEIIHV